jgi:hypothetical protein
MSDTYSQCPQCHHEPAAPLPVREPCPACGIYPFKWGQHRSVPSNKPITRSTLRIRWAAMDAMGKIRRLLAFACLGGYASWRLQTLGRLLRRSGFVLSRFNAQLIYQVMVLSASALAVSAICLAVVYLIKDRANSDVAALGDKLFQYVGLFFVLVVIYSIYLKGILDGRPGIEISWWSLAKLCLVSGLPFGVLACSDQPWRSRDAASLCFLAWCVVYGGYELRYSLQCPAIWFVLFVPLVLSALLGHTLGTRYHQGDWRHEIS